MKQIVLLTTFIFGCQPAYWNSTSPVVIQVETMRTNLKTLSSDDMEGREAGTPGERRAAEYISEQLKSYGVKPFAYETSDTTRLTYFQEFSSVRIQAKSGSGLALKDSSGSVFYDYGDFLSNFHEQLTPIHAECAIVFAGYGITAPEYAYDDYLGVDVKNKIVVVLDGEPQSKDDRFFDGDIATSYTRADFYKRHRARELGARALIVLAYPTLRDRWNESIDFFKKSALTFDETALADSTERIPFFYASESFFHFLFQRAPLTYDKLKKDLIVDPTPPRFEFKGVRGSLTLDITKSGVSAMNIVGKIEGRDPLLKNEYVAIGAHFDHLGKNAKGEVFNGADDDGSGTTVILEIARAIAASGSNRRSILVVFHGAEEKGLIGSKYITDEDTKNPFAWKQVVSQINIDMVGRESVDSIFVIGSDKLSSELKATNEAINRKHKFFTFDYTFDDENDPNRYYYRSDHYNYAKLGIPIVFFFDGMGDDKDYHKITDDFDKINFVKMEKIARLAYALAMQISNRDQRLKVDKKP